VFIFFFFFQEVAVSSPWLMTNEPVDLCYDTWFPTDWLSANIRHTVSVIFSHRTAAGGAGTAAGAAGSAASGQGTD
jgi:hypothetical protein